MYNHCHICDIHLKHLQCTSETSETLKTYTCSIRFQQNLAARRVEHCTARSGYAVAVEKEYGSGRTAMRPPVSGCAAPAIGCTQCPRRAVSAVEASRVGMVRWQRLCGRGGARHSGAARWQRRCSHRGARHGGAGVAAVERKANGRRGGEEGERKTWRSAVVVA
jgi:hypothetical protein